MRQKLVAGNWKMNGGLSVNSQLLHEVVSGVAGLRDVAVAVCVPFPYLAQAQSALAGTAVAWGAQNLSDKASGAYTGEVSASMLNDFACRYVLAGHSERRAIYGESDALVAEKFAVALAAGLTPVLCVGETLAERESGKTAEVVAAQMAAVIDRAGVAAFAKAVVAYEPVWAIGNRSYGNERAGAGSACRDSGAGGARRCSRGGKPADFVWRQRQAVECG